jgi:transposase
VDITDEDNGRWVSAQGCVSSRFRKRGIELIVPYRSNNRERRNEDGRKLRRYKRRWIVERTNAWLGQFRRLLVRHEHLLSTHYTFFYLACFWITLRRYS